MVGKQVENLGNVFYFPTAVLILYCIISWIIKEVLKEMWNACLFDLKPLTQKLV